MQDIHNSADWKAMNGWLVGLIVYGVCLIITLIAVCWSMRNENEPESYNEPGEDGAALTLLVFLWPITWVLFILDLKKSRREKLAQKEQHQSS